MVGGCATLDPEAGGKIIENGKLKMENGGVFKLPFENILKAAVAALHP
jgi:hypothetical protein